MVLVTLGALLTPVQWKRSILGVPSATLCKMLQPVASFPLLQLHAGNQDLLFYVLHTKRKRAVIPWSSARQARPRLSNLYAGMGWDGTWAGRWGAGIHIAFRVTVRH